MSLADGAGPTALVAGSRINSTQTPRSIRETSLYAASLGLFGVLVGLALITPLNAFADEILDDPLGGNWSARFLTLGLFAITGFQLHILTAGMGGKALATDSSERHPSLPGVRWFNGYHAALTDMWTGAVLVVLLIVLAAAVPRGVTVFLAAYIAFLLWNGANSVIYLLRQRPWARLVWRTALNPIALIRLANVERHVPAFPEDVESHNRGDNPGVELMYARGLSYLIWENLILAVWSAGLWLIASSSPGLAAATSLAWLIAVVTAIVLDYRIFPQAFTL